VGETSVITYVLPFIGEVRDETRAIQMRRQEASYLFIDRMRRSLNIIGG
jgi:hypothetical protein